MTEIERLKQDHAAIKAVVSVHKKYGQTTPAETVDYIERRIAELEAEASPWRDAKRILDNWSQLDEREHASKWKVIEFNAHLESENEQLHARIAELAAELVSAKQAAQAQEIQANVNAELAAHKAKPQEVPPLDRWRVLATAVEILKDLSSRIVTNCSHTRRQRMTYDLAAMAIKTANSSELLSKPYEVK